MQTEGFPQDHDVEWIHANTGRRHRDTMKYITYIQYLYLIYYICSISNILQGEGLLHPDTMTSITHDCNVQGVCVCVCACVCVCE